MDLCNKILVIFAATLERSGLDILSSKIYGKHGDAEILLGLYIPLLGAINRQSD